MVLEKYSPSPQSSPPAFPRETAGGSRGLRAVLRFASLGGFAYFFGQIQGQSTHGFFGVLHHYLVHTGLLRNSGVAEGHGAAGLGIAGLEAVYDRLAQAIDQAGEAQSERFLVKLALLQAQGLVDAVDGFCESIAFSASLAFIEPSSSNVNVPVEQ